MAQEPILSRGPFSGRIFVSTRYVLREDGIVESRTKYDVTDQFFALCEQMGMELPEGVERVG